MLSGTNILVDCLGTTQLLVDLIIIVLVDQNFFDVPVSI